MEYTMLSAFFMEGYKYILSHLCWNQKTGLHISVESSIFIGFSDFTSA